MLISAGQLARILGISRPGVLKLAKAGKLPPPNGEGKYDKEACVKGYLAIGGEESDARHKLTASTIQSKAVREHYEALLAKLKHEEKTGKLVKVEVLQKELFGVARVIRDSLLNLPDRILPLLRAETNEGKQYEIFKKEITQALETLAGLLKKYGNGT